ncbi:MAG: hypothetical protein K2X98_03255, partial [Alphaproteobacteria bacterium]|nr:hypothetical protein [Alphaproteobacteria bacterium]
MDSEQNAVAEKSKNFFGHSKKEKPQETTLSLPDAQKDDMFQSPNTANNQEQYLKLEKIIATNENLTFWGVAIFKSDDVFGKGICFGT